MTPRKFTRRHFFKGSAVALAAGLIPEVLIPSAHAQSSAVKNGPWKVLCVGGHPDDPESGCAGTLALYASKGHSVSVAYLTRGERGIPGKSLDEAAAIRTAECQQACNVMGVRSVFLGQIDGATRLDRDEIEKVAKVMVELQPDIVFTHWPIDTHLDHQIASLIAQQAASRLKRRPQIYFFEVNTGSQSHGFSPNVHVDITSVLEKKKAALFAHKSQDGEGIWRQHHEIIARFRGKELGTKAAEAFVLLNRETEIPRLPGL